MEQRRSAASNESQVLSIRLENVRLDKVLQFTFAALIFVVLLFLGFSLYTFPIPDSARYWFGDESWLMLEARTQIVEGVLRHPYAYGATIFHFVGIMGNTWLSSLLYGLPAAVFARKFPIVLIGRTVTYLIAILACFELFRMLRRTTKRAWFAMFGVLLLITTPAFAIASHSARPDLLVGLVVLLVVGYFAKRVDVRYDRVSQWIAFGAIMSILGLTIALHLVTLLAPFALYMICQKGGLEKAKFALSAFLGVLVVAAVLTLVYYLTTGDLSLYGTHGQHVQFMDVTKQKPILRPFSRSVQWNNITQRFVLLWKGAPTVLVLLIATFARVIYDSLRKRATYFEKPELRFTLLASVIVFFSWMLFQTSIEYYVPHLLPLLVYSLVCVLDSILFSELHDPPTSPVLIFAFAVVAFALSLWQVHRLRSQDETAKIYEILNHRAASKLYTTLKEDAMKSGVSRPLVLAESPCAIYLETETNFRIMAPMFVDFPQRPESASTTFKRFGLNYALLYASPLSRIVGQSRDSVALAVEANGILIDEVVSTSFDLWRSYDLPGFDAMDTMKLYKMR